MASDMVCHVKPGPVGRSWGSISREIRELKQTRRRRKRERHLKMSHHVSAIFQLFKVIMPEKCALTILELNWNQRLGQDKIEHLSTYAHVVHTTAKKVISRHRKNEDVFKMSKKWKMHVQSVQKYCFSLSNMQICGVFVAVVVAKNSLCFLQIWKPQFLSFVQIPFENCHSPFSPTTFFEIGVY